MTITGLNHVTLATADLDRALAFYTDTLGARPRAKWPNGAYLELGPIWLCLEHTDRVTPRADDTHLAFSAAPGQFDALAEKIAAIAPLWKTNRSEGASLYFLDPDGHKLELHQGDLETRLAHYRDNPPPGMTIIP